ncbi:1-acylglycerol-3-phosphate O [Ramaria rubella]|nr:1-acylglycerol-3-phosphate O [Ramaria rubella]
MSFLTSLAYISIPLLFLHSVSTHSTLGRYYIRLGIYLSTLGLCSVYGALVSIGLTLVGRRFEINWVVARTFYNLAGRALGISFEVEGEHWLDATRPAILVGNHQSMLDIIYLGRIFPNRASMVAKKELKWVPLLGQYLTTSGAVFLDRSNNANAVKSLAAAGQSMKTRGTSLWLFPEGTRSLSRENTLLPFKKGAFHLAVQAGVPIVPVVCENYSWLYGPGKLESGKLRIRVLKPIPTTNMTAADVPDLATRTHHLMENALQEISTHVEKPLSSDARSESPRLTGTLKSEDRRPEDSEPIDRTASSSNLRRNSEAGSAAETESDEGMVLVGRPT